MRDWVELQNQLGFHFTDISLLQEALTHESFAFENGKASRNNERLEFLGDSVLGLVISDFLYQSLPEDNEGMLSQIKGYLISTAYLAQKALELNLGDYLLLGKGEENTFGRKKNSLLCDMLEALIGGIYLDSGYEAACTFISSHLIPELAVLKNITKDYKSLLQEATQKFFKVLPDYKVTEEKGPAHAKEFTVAVVLNQLTLGEGRGSCKKDAELNAALLALQHLKMNYPEFNLEF